MVRKKKLRYKHLINNKKDQPSIWTIINTVAQVLLTLLAIFGYFYTVQPIRQNQILGEEKAELEFANKELLRKKDLIENDLAKSQMEVEKRQNDINKLKETYTSLEMTYQRTVEIQKKEEIIVSSLQIEKVKLNRDIEIISYSYLRDLALSLCTMKYMNDLVISEKTNFTLFDIKNISTIRNEINKLLGDPYADTVSLVNNLFTENMNEQAFKNSPISMMSLENFRSKVYKSLDMKKDKYKINNESIDKIEQCIIAFNMENDKYDAEKERLDKSNDIGKYDRLREIISQKSKLRMETSSRIDEIKKDIPSPISILADVLGIL